MAAHMKWKQELQVFCKANMAQVQRLTYELCAIPAPTGSEGRRAQFCLSYLRGHGASAYLDEAGNVVFPYACEGSGKVLVLAAHMDTVFPEGTPLGMREEGGRAFCPGIGDDTANLAVLLVLARPCSTARWAQSATASRHTQRAATRSAPSAAQTPLRCWPALCRIFTPCRYRSARAAPPPIMWALWKGAPL